LRRSHRRGPVGLDRGIREDRAWLGKCRANGRGENKYY